MIQLLQGDSLSVLKTLDSESIQCVVTSPPYYGLRDYGCEGQIGLEKSPLEYVQKLVEIFREVHRVLKKDGTLWLNLGDSYATQHSQGATDAQKGWKSGTICGERQKHHGRANGGYLPSKNLLGIPWRVAFALQADWWYLRSDIIWSKPNPMPESVTDRCTKAHEYIFMLTKSCKYYYDYESIKEKSTTCENRPHGVVRDREYGYDSKQKKLGRNLKQIESLTPHKGFNEKWDAMSPYEQGLNGRNKRDVWEIATMPYPEAHFATFPEAIPKLCILAGSKCGDTILDPFAGSFTTCKVALELGRKSIGIELNSAYIEIGKRRCNVTAGLAL